MTESYVYSGNVYKPAAGTTSFALTSTSGNAIKYLEKSDISVATSSDSGSTWTTLTRPAQWDFDTPGTSAVLSSGTSAGVWVRVLRTTPFNDRYTTFAESSLLTSDQLNDGEDFSLYVDQELYDQAANIDGGITGPAVKKIIGTAPVEVDSTNAQEPDISVDETVSTDNPNALTSETRLMSEKAIDGAFSQAIGGSSVYPPAGVTAKTGKLRIDDTGAEPKQFYWNGASWVQIPTKGDKGDQGIQGPAGPPPGIQSPSATATNVPLQSNNVLGQAYASVSADSSGDLKFNFGIPVGQKGDKGDVGDGVNYLGEIDATTAPQPEGSKNGDFYVNTTAGTSSWTGLSTVGVNERLIYNGHTNEWDSYASTDLWQEASNQLYPRNANADVKIGGTLPSAPNISLNASGSASFEGPVGIGTDSPQGELVIRSSTPQIYLEPTSDVQNSRLNFCLTDGSISSAIHAGGKEDGIKFITGGSEKVRFLSNGNVGIGTDSPEAKLTISPGNSTATSIGGRSINYGSNVIAQSGRSGYLVRVDNNFTTNNDNSGFQWIYPHDTGGDANYKVFRASAGATLADTFWVSQAGGAYFAGGVNSDTQITVGPWSSSKSSKLGEGWIGVSNATGSDTVWRAWQDTSNPPTSTITAAGAANFDGTIVVGDFNSVADDGNGCQINSIGKVVGQRKVSQPTSDVFAGYQGTVKQFAVLANGTTQIGGTLPSAPNITLNPNGSGQFSGDFSIGDNVFVNSSVGYVNALGFNAGSGNAIIATDGSAEFASIVKVGNTNVSGEPDKGGAYVNSTGAIVAKRPTNVASSNPVFVGYYGNTKNVEIGADGSATFAGSVGIGTDSPSYQLDVQGAGNSRIQVKNTSVTGEAQFHHTGNGDLAIKNSVSGRNINFFNAGSERMSIDANGNVGIGGALPSASNISLNASGDGIFEGGLLANYVRSKRNLDSDQIPAFYAIDTNSGSGKNIFHVGSSGINLGTDMTYGGGSVTNYNTRIGLDGSATFAAMFKSASFLEVLISQKKVPISIALVSFE